MGCELVGDLLSSCQLDVCYYHVYSNYPMRAPHQFSIFFLAYTQANLKPEIFIELPIGLGVDRDLPREWFIVLDKGIYGLKDAGLKWYKKLREGL